MTGIIFVCLCRNFSSISDIGKRPLGFDKAVWLFNKPGENPCVKITGAKQRHIEIAVGCLFILMVNFF